MPTVRATLVALVLASLPAAAADDAATRDAREHLGRAKIHFKLREFDAAATEFREAYRLKPVPALLFNIGQCERMRGKYRESKFYYEQYLHDVPDAGNADEVKHQIAELTKLIEDEGKEPAAPVVTAPPPPEPAPAPAAAKFVVPLPAAREPIVAALPKPPVIAPPPAPVVEPAPVAVATPEPPPKPEPEPEPVKPEPAPEPTPVVTIAPAPKPEPAKVVLIPKPVETPVISAPYTPHIEQLASGPAPKVEPSRSAWPIVMLVLGAASGGAGGYFGYDAMRTHDAAAKAVFQDDASRQSQDAQTKALYANALFAAAGVAALTGIVGVATW